VFASPASDDSGAEPDGAASGEYDNTKLINLGTNRWSIKPEVGVSVPVGRWFLDAYAGAWFFTDNDEFYPGEVTRSQDPITTLQAHAGYTFRWRGWIAFDATWYGGGSSTSDDGPPSERLSNSRYGATLAIPITPRQSLKIGASTGASTRVGSDFDSVAVACRCCGSTGRPSLRPDPQPAPRGDDRPIQRSRTNVTSNVCPTAG
jgi:hypothetical protein